MIEKISAEERCRKNVVAWLAHHGETDWSDESTRVEPDRVWFRRTDGRDAVLARMAELGLLEVRGAANHGSDVVIAYRECVHRGAAQVVVHKDQIEIDFDHWQPWDVVGGVGHMWEVLQNKFGKRKTDPFAIAVKLRKRGIHAV